MLYLCRIKPELSEVSKNENKIGICKICPISILRGREIVSGSTGEPLNISIKNISMNDNRYTQNQKIKTIISTFP